jgi:hypothetical protein
MNSRTIALPGSVIAAAVLVVGLAVPSAAHEANRLRHKISGSSIKPNSVTGKQIKESSLGVVPKAKRASTLPPLVWHKIITFTHGWHANPAANNSLPVSYAVDAQGLVHLRGALVGGTVNEPAFALPASVVSTTLNMYFPVVASGATVGLLTVSGGTVRPTLGDTATEPDLVAFTDLDGVVFSGH